jgi:hypothetical protein
MEALILAIKVIESLGAEWRGLSVDDERATDIDRAKMEGVADGLAIAQQVAQSIFDKTMDAIAKDHGE